jgi:predicted DNA-binding transcriptional regulator AlpA
LANWWLHTTVHQKEDAVRNLEKLMGVEELAELLGVPPRTIYSWRYRGVGPRAIKVGGAVKYEPAEVRRYLDAQADPRPAA